MIAEFVQNIGVLLVATYVFATLFKKIQNDNVLLEVIRIIVMVTAAIFIMKHSLVTYDLIQEEMTSINVEYEKENKKPTASSINEFLNKMFLKYNTVLISSVAITILLIYILKYNDVHTETYLVAIVIISICVTTLLSFMRVISSCTRLF